MFRINDVEENKTQLRSPKKNFGQDVSVLKQLGTGGFFAAGRQQVQAQNNRFFTHSLPNLSQNTVTGPPTPIRIRTPNVSEKFLVSVIRNQSFRAIVMTSYVSRLVSISQREITLPCCGINQSVTRFINSHYRLLATNTHKHT